MCVYSAAFSVGKRGGGLNCRGGVYSAAFWVGRELWVYPAAFWIEQAVWVYNEMSVKSAAFLVEREGRVEKEVWISKQRYRFTV